jgi:iron complex transport system permease protein
MLIFIVLSLTIVLFALKGLNLLVLGHDNLSNFGINRRFLQYTVLISTAILAGVVTAFCGPIGFIGIIIPHFARMITKTSNHIQLLPVTAILGAILLLLSDTLSHLPANGIVLPINSITAFIGIPFIFWIIFRPSQKIEV